MGKLARLYFPTTYREEGLVGKSGAPCSTSSPPIEKRARGEVGPPSATYLLTTYREEGLVWKLGVSTSPPPIEKRGSWGS